MECSSQILCVVVFDNLLMDVEPSLFKIRCMMVIGFILVKYVDLLIGIFLESDVCCMFRV